MASVLLDVVSAEPAATEWLLYPNPVRGELMVEGDLLREGEWTIEVVNGLGQVLLTERLAVPAGAFRHQLPTASLPAGSYQLRLSNAEQVPQTQAFIKLD